MIYSRLKEGKKQYQYRTYYTNFDGSRKQKNSKWYDTKKECVKYESAFIQSKIVGSVDVTFKEVMDQWLIHQEKRLKSSTYKARVYDTKRLEPLYDRKMEKIKANELDSFFDDHLAYLSYGSKKNSYKHIKSIFRFAKIHYGITNDPFLKMMPLKKEQMDAEVEVVDYDTFESFLDAVKIESKKDFYKNNIEYHNLFTVLYYTGMRLGECTSLTFNDFNGKSLYIHRQYANGEWSTPKTRNSIRRVALDDKTIRIIQDQYIKYKDMPHFTKDWFIFGGYKQIPKVTLFEVKNRACEKANIKPFKIHALRHSHASNLIDAGVNMFKISKRLGHSSISITMDVYGHLMDTEEDEILNAISKSRKN